MREEASSEHGSRAESKTKNTVLTARDLTCVTDDGSMPIIERVNIDVRSQEFAVLVGMSGCGKTTLLKCLAGTRIVASGSIKVISEEERNGREGRLGIAMLTQSPSLYPWLNALDNATFGLKLLGIKSGERRRIGLELMTRLGLEGCIDRPAYLLSGGMRQRVALARALSVKPEVLLMDEPLTSVDEITREIMEDLILSLWRELRLTVLYVTHDLEEAIRMATRILVMLGPPGHIVADVTDIEGLRSMGTEGAKEHLKSLLM